LRDGAPPDRARAAVARARRPRPAAHARARLRARREPRGRTAHDRRGGARRPGAERALPRWRRARRGERRMSTDDRTYESAVARVEEIIRRLDSGEAGLRETLRSE